MPVPVKLKLTKSGDGYSSERVAERRSTRGTPKTSYEEPLSPDKRGKKISPGTNPGTTKSIKSKSAQNVSKATPSSSKGIQNTEDREKSSSEKFSSEEEEKAMERETKMIKRKLSLPPIPKRSQIIRKSTRKNAQEDSLSDTQPPVKKQRRSVAPRKLTPKKTPIKSMASLSEPRGKTTAKLRRRSTRIIEINKDISCTINGSDSSNEVIDQNSMKLKIKASKVIEEQRSGESDFEISKRKIKKTSKSNVSKKLEAVTSETSQKTPTRSSCRNTRQKTPITPAVVEASTPKTRSKTVPIKIPKENSIVAVSSKAPKPKKSLNKTNEPIPDLPPKCPVPCREEQFKNIFEFLISNIENKQSGCLYVSGVPGTGKTLICRTVVKILQGNRNISFDHAYINGLSLSTPDKFWKQLYKAVNGKNEKPISCQKALIRLDAHFKSSKNKKPFVLIIDELDQLIEKSQKLLYNLFEWCDHDQSLFSVVSIFNTINLPEYFASRNISRMGLSRTTFAPYNSQELEEIISLEDYAKDLNTDAKKLISRKVSSISGDVRRAKELAKRAAEIVKSKELSDIKAVDDAFKEIFSSPKVDAIRDCSRLEQNFLRELSNDLEKNGLEVTTLKVVTTNLIKNAPLEGMSIILDDVIRAFKSLTSLSLISAENTHFLEKKIRLNVSPEDIKFALEKE